MIILSNRASRCRIIYTLIEARLYTQFSSAYYLEFEYLNIV